MGEIKHLKVTPFVVAEPKWEDQNPRLLCLSLHFVAVTVLHSLGFYHFIPGSADNRPALCDSACLQSSVATEDQNNSDFFFSFS